MPASARRPAIAAGNSVILKPASATPVCSLLLGEMAPAAGLPRKRSAAYSCPNIQQNSQRDPEGCLFIYG
ncbi:MAG: aldehyde dehydrogenase family protein [Candidatus Moduliflexus flocculans]|nr:aldehyde dehydrogenase family protein [Candidatus Moduliflexus flocculans]